MRFQSTTSGAMLLISVLAIGTVTLAMVLGSAVRLMGELRAGEGESASRAVLAAAESCVQESLLRLTRSAAFTGTFLMVGDISCRSTVTSAGGIHRMIVATANRNRWSRTLSVRVDIVSPKPTILEWREW